MNEEREIIRQVTAAKGDMQAADAFICMYMPFIKSETAKFLNRPPVSGYDDELSIAMIAFHEAICGYSSVRGSFFKYAAMLIKSRLIDYHRKERRHSNNISLDIPEDENHTYPTDILTDKRDHNEEILTRNATRAEIEELSSQMKEYEVSLTDVADNCPKQQRTLEACQKALRYAKENPVLLEELQRTKRLPIAKLCEGSGAARKTLERHRKYMLALLLIYTNGYEIIRGHLKQVMKGVTVK